MATSTVSGLIAAGVLLLAAYAINRKQKVRFGFKVKEWINFFFYTGDDDGSPPPAHRNK